MARAKRAATGAPVELTDGLDFLIRDTRLRLYKYIESRIAHQGVPLRLWFPLRALYRNEGVTQRELGRMLGFGDAHAGVIVRVMQRRRLVYRQPSRVDKRRIDLYLTPAGRATARLTLRHMRAINARIAAGLSAAELRSLRTLLMRARQNLKP
ncbi:MAG TPA: MarR family transcriptional regulator [Stellaceae bacterium]|nr:MarR family transcriptional regulator [Stellaceae bacterium]